MASAAALVSMLCLQSTVSAAPLQWPAVVMDAVAGASVTQEDSEPEAIFIMSTEQPVINVAFGVDASQSFDRPNAGPIARYVWNWGDGTDASTGVTSQHTYTKSGRFTIKLTVYDAENPANSDSATRTVNISSTAPNPGGDNRAPTASLFVNPIEGFLDDEFTFDGRGSRDPDGDPLVYRFNFGDGEETPFTSDALTTHQYAETGSYVVRLTVRDDKNASSDISSTVRVLDVDDNESPVAYIATGPRTGAAPVTLSFDGRVSFDPDGDPLFYEWSFTQGEAFYDSKTGSVISQLFSEPGTYTVVLDVTDTKGATGSSDPQTITISEGGEPVEPPPPAPVPEPEDPPPSYEQRPPSVCGVGMLSPTLACLMCLMAVRRGRQRSS